MHISDTRPDGAFGRNFQPTQTAVAAIVPKTQIGRIQQVMSDGKYRTEQVISETLSSRYPEYVLTGSITAQLRDIRKKSGFQVNAKRVHEGIGRTFEYQVLSAGDIENGPFVTTPVAEAAPSFDAAQSRGAVWGIDDTDCL